MPRIPRRPEDGEEQTELASGDPLATPTPAPQSASTSGDPLTQVTPPESGEKGDLSEAPPVTPASTAAPSEAEVAPGDASSTEDAAPAQSGASAEKATETEQPTAAADPVEQPTTVLPTSGDPLATPAPQPTADSGEVAAQEGEQAPADARPRFRQRTRMRRRLRYLRRLRELAFRDLGGLVFDLHRFGRDRNDLVTAKLEALGNIDHELRALQDALRDRRDYTDLREAGIAACPRCGTLHDTDANYCPGCGATLRSVLVREAFPVSITPADGEQQQEQQQQQPPPAEPQQPTPSS